MSSGVNSYLDIKKIGRVIRQHNSWHIRNLFLNQHSTIQLTNYAHLTNTIVLVVVYTTFIQTSLISIVQGHFMLWSRQFIDTILKFKTYLYCVMTHQCRHDRSCMEFVINLIKSLFNYSKYNNPQNHICIVSPKYLEGIYTIPIRNACMTQHWLSLEIVGYTWLSSEYR